MEIHIVKSGETLSSIAREYGVSLSRLAGENGLRNADDLAVGQALCVRVPTLTHTVRAGDTVYSIARKYGISARTLFQRNFSLAGESRLAVGQEIAISYGEEITRTIAVNAYAYPFINEQLRNETFPYLTYMTPFTYGISSDGGLLPLDDTALLSAAGRYQTASLMHLSTLTEAGSFSNARSSMLLRDVDLQERLIEEILLVMRRSGYYGLDIDFEFVLPAEREAYAAFVRRVRERLHPFGYPVIVALAPKTSAEQKGLLYEAHDYALLGAAADAVFLMTYEWGYTYGPPMAVAPLPQVRDVLRYALSEIPSEKIFLGIPIYGYDWTLPYQKGTSRANSLSPAQAVLLAVRERAEIVYDETAQAPYFNYTDRRGSVHTVWFEDARSVRSKLSLAEEYDLAGIGIWNLLREFPQMWSVLSSTFQIETVL